MPRKQTNVGFDPTDHDEITATAKADGTTPTEFIRTLALLGIDPQVKAAAAADGVTVVEFCSTAIREAAEPTEPAIDAEGIGFLAWLVGGLGQAKPVRCFAHVVKGGAKTYHWGVNGQRKGPH